MPHETITYDVADSLATITLNRPDKRNAMNAAMFRELGDAATTAAGDQGVRAVLVRGEGPSFCAGIDLSSFPDLFGKPARELREFVALAQRPFAVLASMPKPTIAAVRGHALGAGCQLAIACDLRIAADDAQFGILELNFGIIPDLGGNSRLTALVGPARAKELIWTGRRFDAREADRFGVVTRVVTPGDLDGEASALAAALIARAPVPVRHVKALVDRASREPLDALMAAEMDAQIECLSSDDHREAVAAHLEQREPRFQGR
ncbi:MAG: enoyl-CoA hydratase/isomerase family protein [Actinomycetota bacterium]